MAKKTCFVVMGFGKKTDFPTGRTLDLDKTYRILIKPAVEAAGLDCVRADDIVHSGSIDLTMYRQLLEADVVVADISTCNPNALYELGVRHALRPYTTITMAESQIVYPFDVSHNVVRKYEHLGAGIDAEEAARFTKELTAALGTLLEGLDTDSPVYSLLAGLRPPVLEALAVQAAAPAPPIQAPAAIVIDASDGHTLYERCSTTTPSPIAWRSRPTRAGFRPRWQPSRRRRPSSRISTPRCRTIRRRWVSGGRYTNACGRRRRTDRASTPPSWRTSGGSTSAPTTTTGSTSRFSSTCALGSRRRPRRSPISSPPNGYGGG